MADNLMSEYMCLIKGRICFKHKIISALNAVWGFVPHPPRTCGDLHVFPAGSRVSFIAYQKNIVKSLKNSQMIRLAGVRSTLHQGRTPPKSPLFYRLLFFDYRVSISFIRVSISFSSGTLQSISPFFTISP